MFLPLEQALLTHTAPAPSRTALFARYSLIAGLAASVLGVTGASVSALGLHTWGLAGDHRAVIVTQAGVLRSIPTEADTSQKTSPLAAGSLGSLAQRVITGTRTPVLVVH